MSESNYAKKALPQYQKEHPETILMRNNTGMLYTGKMTWKVIDGKKILTIENPVPVFFGVGLSIKDKKTKRPVQKGGGDYIGWTEKEIASPCCGSCNLKTNCNLLEKEKGNTSLTTFIYMIMERCFCFEKLYEPFHPKKIAIFISIETKSKDGKESPDQIRFRETVLQAGGIAEVLREE